MRLQVHKFRFLLNIIFFSSLLGVCGRPLDQGDEELRGLPHPQLLRDGSPEGVRQLGSAAAVADGTAVSLVLVLLLLRRFSQE